MTINVKLTIFSVGVLLTFLIQELHTNSKIICLVIAIYIILHHFYTGFYPEELVYIQGSDSVQEGEWRYDNGQKLTYFYWSPTSPFGHDLRDSLVLKKSDSYGWSEVDGTLTGGFLCERNMSWRWRSQCTPCTSPWYLRSVLVILDFSNCIKWQTNINIKYGSRFLWNEAHFYKDMFYMYKWLH